MSTPEERYQKLVDRRNTVLANTTPEERAGQMTEFLDALSEFGETHFPNASERDDETRDQDL
jgi:hypothetical protein